MLSSPCTQEPNTFHLRTTILPPEEDMAAVAEQLRTFHAGFMAEHATAQPRGAELAGAPA